MDPTCKRCGNEYRLREGCEPSEFCDPCAHIVADSAFQLTQLPNVENRCGAWRDVNDAVAHLCKSVKR